MDALHQTHSRRKRFIRHPATVATAGSLFIFILPFILPISDPRTVLSLETDNGAPVVGEVVPIRVMIEAKDPVNVLEASITLDDSLLLVDTDKGDSPVTFWVEDPTLISPHVLHFSGGILRPGGFTGTDTILTLHISAATSGYMFLRFINTSVLANDGKGTSLPVKLNDLSIPFHVATGTTSATSSAETATSTQEQPKDDLGGWKKLYKALIAIPQNTLNGVTNAGGFIRGLF